MKTEIKRRKPDGPLDYLSLAVTTVGVGYLPFAPGTYGSLVAVGFYVALAWTFRSFRYAADLASPESLVASIHAFILIGFLLFTLLGSRPGHGIAWKSRSFRGRG